MFLKAFISFIIVFCFCSIDIVQAQAPIIFQVKKPGSDSKIRISSKGDIFWMGEDNKVCISSDTGMKISKIEVQGADVTFMNDCYNVRLKPVMVEISNGVTGILGTTVLSVYELLPDGSSRLVITSTYSIGVRERDVNYE